MGHTILETGNHTSDFLSQSFNTLTQIESLKIYDLEGITDTYSKIEPNVAKLNGGVPPQYHILEELGYSFFPNQPNNIKKEYLNDVTTEDMAKLLFLHTRDILLNRVLENTNIFNYKLEDIINKVYLYEHYHLNVKNVLLYRPELIELPEEEIEKEIFESRGKEPFSKECRELIERLNKEYVNERNYQLLSDKEVYILFEGRDSIRRSLRDRDELQEYKNELYNVIVKYNMRLIFSVARKFFKYTDNSDDHEEQNKDILALGMEGILPAIRKFDHKNGKQFSTVATEWIRQNISRRMDEIFSTIYVPYHTRLKFRAFRKEELVLSEQKNQTPSFEETWESLIKKGLVKNSEKEMFKGTLRAKRKVSLDSTVDKDKEGRNLIETIPSPEDSTVLQRLEDEENYKQIQDEIQKLPPQLKEIAQRYYNYENPQTSEEIGKDLNITSAKIRKLLVQATDIIKASGINKSSQKDI